MSETAVLESEETEVAYHGVDGSTLSGKFRFHRAVASQFVQHTHDLIVFLPPGYSDAADRQYPVLYLQDGQNVFDAATAFGGHEWHVDETAQDMIAKGLVEPMIIVGIYNTGQHRIAEYTPSVDRKQNAGGEGELYARFIVEEVKPLIDSTYRTRQGRSDTALAGSSLGGLISLYLGLRYPHVFGKLAVMSPSIWWDRRMILRHVRALKQPTGQRIWLDIGELEGSRTLTNTRDLRDLLVERGWREGEDLVYVEVPGSRHDEDAWAARFGAVLGFLFPAQQPG